MFNSSVDVKCVSTSFVTAAYRQVISEEEKGREALVAVVKVAVNTH